MTEVVEQLPVRDDWQILDLRLRYQHQIERITMIDAQPPGTLCVHDRDGEVAMTGPQLLITLGPGKDRSRDHTAAATAFHTDGSTCTPSSMLRRRVSSTRSPG